MFSRINRPPFNTVKSLSERLLSAVRPERGECDWLTLGDKARDEGRWKEAIAAYAEYLASVPTDFNIWVQLGHAYKEVEYLQEADEAYNRALKLDDNNPDLLLNLGHLRKVQDNIYDALCFYRRSFGIDGNEFAAAEIYSLTGVEADLTNAEEELAGYWRARGDKARDEKHWDKAAEAYVKYLENTPNDFNIWVQLGHAYKELGSFEEADAAYNNALALDNNNPDLLLNLGHLRKLQNVIDSALDFYERSFKIDENEFAAAEIRSITEAQRLLDSTIKYAVSDAHFECLRRVSLTAEVALFVTHSPDGRIRAHVKHYLRALVRHGICPILLIASDVAFVDRSDPVLDILGGVFVRQNIGFDFAAWAHALSLHAELYNVEILYLLNDSIIGPLNDNMFSVLLEQIRTSKADFFGLTDNYQLTWHVQSYFLGFKRSALQCDRLRGFFNSVVSYSDKTAVITQYETVLAPMLVRAGLKCQVMYPADSDAKTNHTITGWKSLISRGFPFVKITTLRDNFPNVDINGWREILDAAGFDVSLAEQAISRVRQTYVNAPVNVPLSSPPLRAGVNFIGPADCLNGLGTSARGFIEALSWAKVRTNVLPWGAGFEHVSKLEGAAWPSCEVQPINLIHLNLDLITQKHLVKASELPRLASKDRYNIGIVYWELASVYPEWFKLIQELDEIWCASSFMVKTFQAASKRPVRLVRPALDLDRPSGGAGRKELGLKEGRFVFAYVFDANSGAGRKNPLAFAEAYAAEFDASEGASCLLKIGHSQAERPEVAAMRRLAAQRADIVLLERVLNPGQMRDLFHRIDCYVSPHRSEGLGLTVLEAMAAGKPVIATAYGGTTDFVTPEAGYSVEHKLIEIGPGHEPYRPHYVWADPSQASLRSAMREAFGNQSAARAKGAAGRELVLKMFSARQTGTAIAAELKRISNGGGT